MSFINGLCVLLLYQLIGEVTARYFDLPIPGPVIGMLLLLITLMLAGRVPADADGAATALLGHLSLLFVPAGVGVMVHFELITAQWLPILTALVVSTLVSLVLAALAMKWTARLTGAGRSEP